MATKAPAPAPAAPDTGVTDQAQPSTAPAEPLPVSTPDPAPAAPGGLSSDERAELEALRAAVRAEKEAQKPAEPDAEARKAAALAAEVSAAMPQRHTYPDGSEVYGCPPWPELSPLQREAKAKREYAHSIGEGTRIPAGNDPFGTGE